MSIRNLIPCCWLQILCAHILSTQPCCNHIHTNISTEWMYRYAGDVKIFVVVVVVRFTAICIYISASLIRKCYSLDKSRKSTQSTLNVS